MKEYTSIEKDTILRCFYLGVSINYQSCQDIINILVSDGYVVLRTSVNGRAYHITDKGKGFILQGGYAKQDNERKQEKIEKWKTSTINLDNGTCNSHRQFNNNAYRNKTAIVIRLPNMAPNIHMDTNNRLFIFTNSFVTSFLVTLSIALISSK